MFAVGLTLVVFLTVFLCSRPRSDEFVELVEWERSTDALKRATR